MSEKNEEKELTEEEVIGEELSQGYMKEVSVTKSAEVKMVLYVVPVAIALIVIALVLSKLNY